MAGVLPGRGRVYLTGLPGGGGYAIAPFAMPGDRPWNVNLSEPADKSDRSDVSDWQGARRQAGNLAASVPPRLL